MQPKPAHRLYGYVYLALTQLLPKEVDSRLTNMTFLMIGIFGAHRVQTGELAASIPLHIKKLSIMRRMGRFLANGAARVRTSRGHCSPHLQLTLLRYVRSLLPVDAHVSLVGDCEFGPMLLVITLQDWH